MELGIFISLVSRVIIFVAELCKGNCPNLLKYCDFFQNTGKISKMPERNSSIHPEMFYSKADLNKFIKHSLKRNCDEVLFSVKSQPAIYWKRTPSQLFSDDFSKTFHDIALCQNAGEISRLYRNGSIRLKMFKKKTDLENFTKFSQNKLIMPFCT